MCTTFNLFGSTQFDYLHHFISSWSNLLTIVLFCSYYRRKLTFRCMPFHFVLLFGKNWLKHIRTYFVAQTSHMQWWKETRSIQMLLAGCTFDSSVLKSKWHVISASILTFNMLFVTGSNVWIFRIFLHRFLFDIMTAETKSSSPSLCFSSMATNGNLRLKSNSYAKLRSFYGRFYNANSKHCFGWTETFPWRLNLRNKTIFFFFISCSAAWNNQFLLINFSFVCFLFFFYMKIPNLHNNNTLISLK